MKAKIKKNKELLFCKGVSNDFSEIAEKMIINFNDKGIYLSFKQCKNHLLINTTKGEIDIVFTGSVPILSFESYCKNKLVLADKNK